MVGFRRWFIALAWTLVNAVVAVLFVRVYLPIQDLSNSFAGGPGTAAIDLVPTIIVIAIGISQLGALAYAITSGVSEERAARTVRRVR